MSKDKTVWLNSRGPFPCNIAFCPDRKSFDKTWKKSTDSELPEVHCNERGARAWQILGTLAGLCPVYIICVEPGQLDWAEIAAMIAHEAVHVCQWLMEQIGEDNPGCETEAYIVQSITREILKWMDMPERT